MRVITLVSRVAVGLFMVPYMIHALGDRSFGLWALVGALIGYYGILDLGLARAVGRYVSRALAREEFAECDRLVNTALLLYSLLGLVVLLTACAIVPLSPVIWSDPADASVFAPLILILGFNLALGFPVRAFSGVVIARLRHDAASAFSLLTLVLQTGLIIWTLETGGGLVALGWVTLLAGLPEKALLVYLGRRQLPSLRLGMRFARRSTARALFSFSLFSSVGTLSQLLRFQTDAIILSAFLGLPAVTHYRVASTLTRYYRQTIIAVFGAALPFFSMQEARGDARALERSFFLSLRLSVAISSFVSFGLVAWGEAFIVRWVGQDYLDAYPCLVVLSIAAVFQLWQSTFPTLLLSSGHERMFALLAAIQGVSNVLLSLALVQPFGMLGVAIGALVPSFVVRLLLQPALGCRVVGIAYRSYVSQLAKTVLWTGVCLLPAFAVSTSFLAPDYPRLLAVALVSGALYSVGFWFLAFSRAERRTIRRALEPSRRGARRREQPASPP